MKQISEKQLNLEKLNLERLNLEIEKINKILQYNEDFLKSQEFDDIIKSKYKNINDKISTPILKNIKDNLNENSDYDFKFFFQINDIYDFNSKEEKELTDLNYSKGIIFKSFLAVKKDNQYYIKDSIEHDNHLVSDILNYLKNTKGLNINISQIKSIETKITNITNIFDKKIKNNRDAYLEKIHKLDSYKNLKNIESKRK
jgi:hypothetical protein